ncbi:MAG: symmetrical bis(5'-nucleosyl)-tetraphosphatase [Actinomycetes bacterium]
MALYAIGDVQGCYDSLRRLLKKIRFDASVDRLWFTGDLVNRGPRSLDVLRFVADLGERATTVLGNHDLHLLAIANGAHAPKRKDTIGDILVALDRADLLQWLARLPLLHCDDETGAVLVHAGLLPQWDIAQALRCAREAEAAIRSPGALEFFKHMYGDEPNLWRDELGGVERIRLIVNTFTRLRFCDPDGRANYEYKGPPGSQPSPLLPWFAVPGRRSKGRRVIFGHWSTLGLFTDGEVIGIDTGCCWGGSLTAVRLANGDQDEHAVSAVECSDGREVQSR